MSHASYPNKPENGVDPSLDKTGGGPRGGGDDDVVCPICRGRKQVSGLDIHQECGGCAGIGSVSVERASQLAADGWRPIHASVSALMDALGTRDLRDQDLSTYDLSGEDLSGCDLRSQQLANRSLRRAILNEARLDHADLRGADLLQTRLIGASLYRTVLSRANATSAQLRGADLREADLSEADLTWAAPIEADLTGANLSRAVLRRAQMAGANLSRARLGGAVMVDARLEEANLSGADLQSGTLQKAKLARADLSGADLRGAALHEADLAGANLSGADLRGANLYNAHPETAASLEGTDLRHVEGISATHIAACVKKGAIFDYDEPDSLWFTDKANQEKSTGATLLYLEPMFGYVLDRAAHLQVWKRPRLEPNSHRLSADFNLEAVEWCRRLSLSELSPGETPPPIGEVGQYGKLGAVLAHVSQQQFASIGLVELHAYGRVGAQGIAAFLTELEATGTVVFREARVCYSELLSHYRGIGLGVHSLALVIPESGLALTWGKQHCHESSAGTRNGKMAQVVEADGELDDDEPPDDATTCVLCEGSGCDECDDRGWWREEDIDARLGTNRVPCLRCGGEGYGEGGGPGLDWGCPQCLGSGRMPASGIEECLEELEIDRYEWHGENLSGLDFSGVALTFGIFMAATSPGRTSPRPT